MKVEIEITIKLKKGILNPEAGTISRSLLLLGYRNIEYLNTAKIFYITINSQSEDDAVKTADEMCRRILANPVIEDYHINVIKPDTG